MLLANFLVLEGTRNNRFMAECRVASLIKRIDRDKLLDSPEVESQKMGKLETLHRMGRTIK